ncbi:MAG: hypothetical protein HXX13_08685 [Bacteroidetes bacterium]|nr:hypothetical protein [Bacteroidota bacterium]
MNELQVRFIRNLAIVSTLVSIAGLSQHFLLPTTTTPALPWLILLFILTTFTLFNILLKASEKKFSLFANYFMAASAFKLLLLLIVITIYLYFRKEDAFRFVVTTCVLYLVYTIFEVFWLLKINKQK